MKRRVCENAVIPVIADTNRTENTMHTDTYWDTIDFRPAPTGWELAYLPDTPEEELNREPLPGWLIQELVTFDPHTMEDLPHTGRASRRVIAAQVVPGEGLSPADNHPNFWMELGPDEYVSTAAVRQAVEERRGVATPGAAE